MKCTTDWVEYRDGTMRERVRATYGIDYDFARRNSQAPYFSITYDLQVMRGIWRDVGGGAAGDTIAKHFPGLAHLIKWHLCGVGTGPMHYLANALYFLDMAAGRVKRTDYDPEPMAAFKRTIVYGAVPVDAAFDLDRDPATIDRETAQAWLEVRLPALLDAFLVDMRRAEVLEAPVIANE